MTDNRVPRSGIRHRLVAHGYEVEVASVGATLRLLRKDGRDLVAGFDADRVRPAMRGALLVPWPNRLRDGAYDFDGERHELVVTEPETRTAIHGLVAWLDFRAVEQSDDRVVLETTLAPQPGYTWRLRVRAEFTLDADGLRQEVEVANESDRPAPVGIGGHPYLLAGPTGDGAIDRWTLQLDAARAIVPSADRMLPTRETTFGWPHGAALDFRTARSLEHAVLNHAYTEVARDSDGVARARLLDETGRGVQVEWDERCPWVHVYTADAAVDGIRRGSVAIEPMTCPPDAFTSKRDLVIVAPGSSTSAGWRIAAVG